MQEQEQETDYCLQHINKWHWSSILQILLVFMYTWSGGLTREVVVAEGGGLARVHQAGGAAHHVTRGPRGTLLLLPLGRLAHPARPHLQLETRTKIYPAQKKRDAPHTLRPRPLLLGDRPVSRGRLVFFIKH